VREVVGADYVTDGRADESADGGADAVAGITMGRRY
jgi:hypothetical protein